VSTGYGSQFIKVWIDFNDDFTFTTDEIVVNDYQIAPGEGPGSYTETMTLTVPAGATLGDHLMRMKANWNQAVPDEACDDTDFGETEDYTASLSPVGLDEQILGYENLQVIDMENGTYSIQFDSDVFNEQLLISIIDIQGKKIIENWVTPVNGQYRYELDMNGAAKGTYLARLWNAKAGKIAKFVVR
jgi:hypothetical protein